MATDSAVPTRPPSPPRRARVVLAAALVLTVATFGPPGGSSPARAAAPGGAAAAAGWLADQLDDGTYRNPLASGPDHGMMIDAVFAMVAAGREDLAEPIVEVLDDRGGAIRFASYVSFLPGQDTDRVSGSVAKLLVAAEVTGRDVHDFGGLDLVAETRASVIDAGPEAGRITDHGPNIPLNNSNTFGQALAVIGLAGADARFDDTVEALLRQQCSSGYFRIFFTKRPDGSPTTCDQGATTGGSPTDGDATAMGLHALLVARSAGATGLDDPITRAVGWLQANQDPSGGWGGGVSTTAPNTNSTGLIVQALAAADADPAVISRGEGYLASAQVGDADASTPLGADTGAIAYTPAEHDAARTTGITSRDTWIRATAQASLGLSQVGFAELVSGEVPEPSGPTTPSPSTSTAPSTAPSSSTVPTTAATPSDPGRTGHSTVAGSAPGNVRDRGRSDGGTGRGSNVNAPVRSDTLAGRSLAHEVGPTAARDRSSTGSRRATAGDAGVGTHDRARGTTAGSRRGSSGTATALDAEHPTNAPATPGGPDSRGPSPIIWVAGILLASGIGAGAFRLASRGGAPT